jgi:hypothetical protein
LEVLAWKSVAFEGNNSFNDNKEALKGSFYGSDIQLTSRWNNLGLKTLVNGEFQAI